MPDLLLRALDPELKARLAERARRSGRSLSAEAIEILESALPPAGAGGVGSALVALFRDAAGEDA